jgi:hypothetical protein
MNVKRFSLVLATLATALGLNAYGAELVEVAPLSNSILVAHFDDGYVIHHTIGTPRSNETIVVDTLMGTQAQLPDSYVIKSIDDPNYSGDGKSPTSVGRKSKMTEWSFACVDWDGYNCSKAGSRDHAKEHWLYLNLPHPLVSGRTYTIETGSLASNKTSETIVFNEQNLRSEAIHVNIVGYSTSAPKKYGYLYAWLGDQGGIELSQFEGAPFQIRDASSKNIVFNGTINLRNGDAQRDELFNAQSTLDGNFTGSKVWDCDFSAFNTPGDYVLTVPGIGSSFPFEISTDVHWEPFYWSLKSISMNRSGIELSTTWADMNRPAPHNPTVTPGFANRLFYTTSRYQDMSTSDAAAADRGIWEAGKMGNLEAWGWYQDAGDWDAYYHHSRVPTWLIFLYETNPEKWNNVSLNIPESNNDIPDLIDEAMWLPRYYHRVRHEIMDKGWGTGGVGGARTLGDLWGHDESPEGNGQGSWQDVARDWYVSGEDVWTTYRYAALSAQFAMVLARLGKTDPNGVDWAAEAVSAYTWAKDNTVPDDENLKLGYECNLSLDRAYAAASMFGLTGTQEYLDQLKADVAQQGWESWSSPTETEAEAILVYLLLPGSLQDRDIPFRNQLRQLVENRSNMELVTHMQNRAMRWGGNPWMPLLVGAATTPLIQVGLMTSHLAKEWNPTLAATYLEVVYSTADYFLGTNPLNMTWITGVGDRSPKAIFHMDSWYIKGYNNPRKGFIPYGPWDPNAYIGANSTWNPQLWKIHAYPEGMTGTTVNWPMHEAWFEAGTAPMTGENTITQTQMPSALTYGFLWSLSGSKTGPGFEEPVKQLNVVKPSLDLNWKVSPNEIQVTGIPQGGSLTLFSVSGKRLTKQLESNGHATVSMIKQGSIAVVRDKSGKQLQVRMMKAF